MCDFCNVTGKEKVPLIEFPYFHKGKTEGTGLRLVRAYLPELDPYTEVWNICADGKYEIMNTFVYFCPRCGRQLAHFVETEINEVSSQADENSCINI